MPSDFVAGYGATHPRRTATTTADARRDAGPVFRAALGYQRYADQFSEVTGKIAQWAVIPTVIVGFVNVVLRYVGQATEQRLTNNSIIELQWYLYSAIFLFGFAYILKHQINARVDFWFAKQTITRKAWIDFVGNWIGLVPFAMIGIYVSVPQAWQSVSVWEQSPDANGLPRGPIKALLAIAFMLLLIQAIAEQIKLYAVITGRGEMVRVDLDKEKPIRVE
ncbi:MAG: TRAP transporter small permease subunit [Acidimicrobiia bacterium]